MTYSTLLTERTGPVLKITTNRPDVLNAQSRILLEELDDAFAAGVKDNDVRVIILAGAGKHFSAGHDLGSPQEMEDQKKTPLEPGFRGEYRRLWSASSRTRCAGATCRSPPSRRSRAIASWAA
jgi:enoyl-CoA hydratase